MSTDGTTIDGRGRTIPSAASIASKSGDRRSQTERDALRARATHWTRCARCPEWPGSGPHTLKAARRAFARHAAEEHPEESGHRTLAHDDETRERALELVAAGHSAAAAAKVLGVGASSVARWVRAAQ